MFDILHYSFMQRALISGIIIGIVCSVIGVYIVLKGISFIGAGIAHASFGGVALGFLLGINPLFTAIVFCLFTGWGIGFLSHKNRIKEDTAVGIFFASTMALGILFIGLMKGYNVDLFGYLFGSILAVTEEDLIITISLGFIILTFDVVLFKELMFITFDREMAEVTGIPTTKIYFLLISLIALTVVLSIKVVGIILVSALLITPAATAYQLTEEFKRMMFFSILFGVSGTIAGLFLSYWLNTASGATIVVVITIIFFISLLLSPKRRKKTKKISAG
ncbi:metal ABC transporter permease [candidate division KSB1 bacterium]|nr:MAG: metal ABC transporter permease [candidate division KSB1 bacterium]